MNNLEQKLNTLNKFFDVDIINNSKIDSEYIKKYFLINKISYSLFHDDEFLHFAISRDGIYKKEDLLNQIKFVEEYIVKNNAKDVLELGCGRGGNSIYLAEKYPEKNFFGLDLTKTQLEYAVKKSKHLKNFQVQEGDFNKLNFLENQFDVVFVFEALCYSLDKENVLRQVKNILKPGGLFIIIDGYWRDYVDLDKTEAKVKELIEIGMALKNLDSYSVLKDAVNKADFQIIYEKEIAKLILPNAERFEKFAESFFKFGWLANLIIKIFPNKLTFNIISGYLIAETIRRGLSKYYITILKK